MYQATDAFYHQYAVRAGDTKDVLPVDDNLIR
jgi:hypothetical protein